MVGTQRKRTSWYEDAVHALSLPFATRVMSVALVERSIYAKAARDAFELSGSDADHQVLRRALTGLRNAGLLIQTEQWPEAMYVPETKNWERFLAWINNNLVSP